MLLLTERRDYFFYLYVVGVAGQLWLTLLALLHYPDAQHLEPVPGSDEAAYEVRLYFVPRVLVGPRSRVASDAQLSERMPGSDEAACEVGSGCKCL